LQPKLAFYENVAAVSFSTKDAKRPLIEVVRSDMEELGYMFVHQKLDSQDFLVPQRRNRVWGIAIPSTGEVDLHNFAAVYSDKLALFASLGIRFPKDDVFNPDAPKDKIESPVLQEHVQNAIEAATLAGRSTDVFVDTATSPQRAMPREALYIYIYIYIYKYIYTKTHEALYIYSSMMHGHTLAPFCRVFRWRFVGPILSDVGVVPHMTS
jgi:site-specific DNA-cytosine methylase